jgi:hypothetical protein
MANSIYVDVLQRKKELLLVCFLSGRPGTTESGITPFPGRLKGKAVIMNADAAELH